MICSAEKTSPEAKKSTAVAQIQPTVNYSKIDSTGRFHIQFSEAMNLESIFAKTSKNRRLRGGISTKSSSKDSE